jgi:hypothetical protein
MVGFVCMLQCQMRYKWPPPPAWCLSDLNSHNHILGILLVDSPIQHRCLILADFLHSHILLPPASYLPKMNGTTTPQNMLYAEASVIVVSGQTIRTSPLKQEPAITPTASLPPPRSQPVTIPGAQVCFSHMCLEYEILLVLINSRLCSQSPATLLLLRTVGSQRTGTSITLGPSNPRNRPRLNASSSKLNSVPRRACSTWICGM